MTATSSVLITVVGRNFDGIDFDSLAHGNDAQLVQLAKSGKDLAEVISAYADETGYLYVGSGNLNFDSRVAGACAASVVLIYDEPGLQQELAEAQIIESGATLAGACTAEQLEETVRAAFALKVEAVMSPELFQHSLAGRARAAGSTIVLPEGNDDRILQAAHEVLIEGTAKLIILGEEEAIRQRCREKSWDLSGARIIEPSTSPDMERYAAKLTELRKHKGMTLEKARETIQSVSYFATMMVLDGVADGMVSGAVHTTAETIKPALQIIKTTPEASVVSSIFLMVLPGQVFAFGDCAVNPNPTQEQLASIAVTSADTASRFGLDPKVAMLSYSTGNSGAGPDVDRAAGAVQDALNLKPDLVIDGPLQFDAAIDPGVAKRKMPNSPVAGQANVFIFPDLASGNITYKAVQRSANALAVGPILQGLKKPINDLSRGATVPDIVNTIAITAIQAGGLN